MSFNVFYCGVLFMLFILFEFGGELSVGEFSFYEGDLLFVLSVGDFMDYFMFFMICVFF